MPSSFRAARSLGSVGIVNFPPVPFQPAKRHHLAPRPMPVAALVNSGYKKRCRGTAPAGVMGGSGPMPGWLIRHARARARLLLSAALAIAVAALLPGAPRPATRLLLGWDAGVVVFLAACWSMMGEATPERLRQRAQQQDEGKWAILTLTTAAALSNVFAIGFELSGTKELS